MSIAFYGADTTKKRNIFFFLSSPPTDLFSLFSCFFPQVWPGLTFFPDFLNNDVTGPYWTKMIGDFLSQVRTRLLLFRFSFYFDAVIIMMIIITTIRKKARRVLFLLLTCIQFFAFACTHFVIFARRFPSTACGSI